MQLQKLQHCMYRKQCFVLFLSGVHLECCRSGIFRIHALQRANPEILIFHTCSQVQPFLGFPSNVFVQAQRLLSFKSYFRAAEESGTTPNLHDVGNCSILKKKNLQNVTSLSLQPCNIQNGYLSSQLCKYLMLNFHQSV